MIHSDKFFIRQAVSRDRELPVTVLYCTICDQGCSSLLFAGEENSLSWFIGRAEAHWNKEHRE